MEQQPPAYNQQQPQGQPPHRPFNSLPDIDATLRQKIDMEHITRLYESLRNEKQKYVATWEEIAKYTNINMTQIQTPYDKNKGEGIDHKIYDPSVILAINSAANNLFGILIGDGDFFTLKPSAQLQKVLKDESNEEVNEYFKFLNETLQREFNNAEGNFKSCYLMHLRDSATFGTSGVGVARSNRPHSDGILDFINFSVDVLTIGEGRSGSVDHITLDYKWSATQIISSFFLTDDRLDERKLKHIPSFILDNYNQQVQTPIAIRYTIIHNPLYKHNADGKLGSKYLGLWYLPQNDKTILHIEYYKKRPLHIVRVDKIRAELYGRADGTKIISTIRLLNNVIKEIVDNIAKQNRPPLAIFRGGLVNRDILDLTAGAANEIQLFNGNIANPIQKLMDVGDPSALVKFIIPYFKEVITTAFHVDILLDSNSGGNHTATEMVQRYNIRAKMLYSLVYQHLSEVLTPLIDSALSILYQAGALGISETQQQIMQQRNPLLIQDPEQQTIIPEPILTLMAKGKQWYDIDYTADLARASLAAKLENMQRLLSFTAPLMQADQSLQAAFKSYDYVKTIDNLLQTNLFVDEIEYNRLQKEISQAVKAQVEAQQQAAAAGVSQQ